MRAELDALVADHKVRTGSIFALKVAFLFCFLTTLTRLDGHRLTPLTWTIGQMMCV